MVTVSEGTTFNLPHSDVKSFPAHLPYVLVSGLLLGLAFPTPGWWPLAYVALVPASLAAVRSSSMRWLVLANLLGWWAWWLVMLRWLTPVTVPGYIAACLLLSGHFTLAFVGIRLIGRRLKLPLMVALPVMWLALEIVREHFPFGGFGWFSIGYTMGCWKPGQSPGWITQSADVFGVMGPGLVITAVSGFIADLLTLPLWRAKGGRRRMRRTIRAELFLIAAMLAAAGGYGFHRSTQFAAMDDAPTVRIAVIQTNVPQSNKSSPTLASLKRDWDEMVRLTRAVTSAATQQMGKPDLVAWPETMVPGPIDRAGVRDAVGMAGYWERVNAAELERGKDEGYQAMADSLGVKLADLPTHLSLWWRLMASFAGRIATLTEEGDINLLVGVSTTEETLSKDGEVKRLGYNSVYLYRPLGRDLDRRYDKMHLVPFGEYIPGERSVPFFKKLIMDYFSPYASDFSNEAGTKATVFDVPVSDERLGAPARVATPICFEDAVSRVCRRLAYADGEKRVDVLVNMTNDGWFAGSSEQAQHVQIASFRCIENRVPMARAVNTGYSGFIDSQGRVLGLVTDDQGRTQDVAGYGAAALRVDHRVSPFGQLGRLPQMLVLLAALVLLVWSLIAPRKLDR